MSATLDFSALLAWADEEARKWEGFFRAHPQAMELRTDIAHTENVRGLLVHIFAVDLAYTFRIQGKPHDFGEIAARVEGDPFKVGAEARQWFRDFIANSSHAALDETVSFGTVSSGQVSATRRKMLAHTLLHAIRHWAQLATLIRQNGLPDPGKHDFLFSSGMK